MQYSHLTDDDLWRVVVKNTNAMSVLFDQQHEVGIRGLPERSAMLSISRAIDRLEQGISGLRFRASPSLFPNFEFANAV